MNTAAANPTPDQAATRMQRLQAQGLAEWFIAISTVAYLLRWKAFLATRIGALPRWGSGVGIRGAAGVETRYAQIRPMKNRLFTWVTMNG